MSSTWLNAQLQSKDHIQQTQWVLPTRFPGLDPECCDALLGHFGADRVRFGDGFGLCLLMSNSDWHLCIFSDLPLGTNRGIVGIQVEDCPERFRETLEGDFLRDFALGRTIEETRKSLDQSFGSQGQFDF